MPYFKHFPTTDYPFTDDGTLTTKVTNVLKRMRVLTKIQSNVLFYDTYFVKEHDTPEIVSEKVYGIPGYHWVIMLINNITNARYDWLLDNSTFRRWVEKKYRGYNITLEDGFDLVYETKEKILLESTHSATHNADGVHHYEDSDGYEVMSTAAGAISVSNRTHEEAFNDKRREIDILKPEYLSQFVKEFKLQIRK